MNSGSASYWGFDMIEIIEDRAIELYRLRAMLLARTDTRQDGRQEWPWPAFAVIYMIALAPFAVAAINWLD
jgi:hypothetical protein